MRVTQEAPPFNPIHITLETLEEAQAFRRILENARIFVDTRNATATYGRLLREFSSFWSPF